MHQFFPTLNSPGDIKVRSLTHPPVDDSLSVQEKQTNGDLCSIKPAKLKKIQKINKCTPTQ